MKLDVDPDKVADHGTSAERGYDVWKREKIERGRAQANDRSILISAEQVLRDLNI